MCNLLKIQEEEENEGRVKCNTKQVAQEEEIERRNAMCPMRVKTKEEGNMEQR